MDPSEMNIFQLVELARSGQRAAALKELTLRFRAAAKEASKRSHALGLEVHDGRAGEPLPPEENWDGTPVVQNRQSITIDQMHQMSQDAGIGDDQ